MGLLHKDRREFLQAFQCSGKRQVLGAVGHPGLGKSSHQRGKHSNEETGTETLAGHKSQRLPRAIQGPGSEMVFFQGSQTE